MLHVYNLKKSVDSKITCDTCNIIINVQFDIIVIVIFTYKFSILSVFRVKHLWKSRKRDREEDRFETRTLLNDALY